MKKCLIFGFIFFVFGVINAREHTITKIFEEGKAIQLSDGSIWSIGYWSWNDFYDQPKIYDWQIGDDVEFFSLWKGLSSKAIFHITNLRTGQDVRSWLYLGPDQDKTLRVLDVDPSTGIITLEDNSKWQAVEKSDRYFHLYEVIWERRIFLLKNTLGNFYLCREGSEVPKGIEVFQLQD